MPTPRHLGPDDVSNLLIALEPALSPDGSMVAFTRSAPDVERDRDVGHVWVVPAAGGEPARWTSGEQGDGAPSWSPDGRRLAFLSARGQGKGRQVWVLETGGGEARRLTDLPGGVLEFAWSPAGDRIACVAPVRPAAEGDIERARPVVIDRLRYKVDGLGVVAGAHAHLFVVALDGGGPRQLTFGDSWAYGPAWSPDGARIAYVDATHPERDLDLATHLFVVPEAGGSPRRITDGPGLAGWPAWSPDGRRLVFVGRPDVTHLMSELYVVDAGGGEASRLLPGLDRTVMPGAPAYPGGRPEVDTEGRVTFCARVGGCVHVLRASLDGGEVETLVGGDRVASGISTAAGALAFVAADAGQPGDLFIRGADGEERRLTELNRALLEEAPPVRPERRVFMAPDGAQVEAFVYRPAAEGRAPLLLDVHGGPHNAFAPALSGMYLYRQELVARGWCVVAPNPRGSDGYGLRFLQGVTGGMGRDDQQDFLAVVDGLVADGGADPGRLAVTGYSYGGFTTAWLAGRTRRFRAAVAGGVVANWASMYGASDLGPYLHTEVGVEPFDSWKLYDELSPVRHTAEMRTPLLLLHGEADERCPVGQAEELFALLRRQRRNVRLVRYPGASHLFPFNGRLSHRRDYQRRVVDWVTEHVAGAVRRPAVTADAVGLGERLAAAAELAGVPGVAIGILMDGREEHAAHGVTSVENPLPVDRSTLFQIGSITKTFTATLLMRLVEQGLVDLSEPVRRYVPELRLHDPAVAEQVVVRQLLNHTAGWVGDHFVDLGDGDDALARYVESMAELEQVTPLGAFYSYNNASFSLAGRLIEHVTGQTYEAALRGLVLDPLGMEQSLLFPVEVMPRRFVAGHVRVDGSTRVARPWPMPRTATPAGGLVSTTIDLLRYARFQMGDGEGLLRRESLEQMRRVTFNGRDGDGIGLAWSLHTVDGVLQASHSGGTNGQQSLLLLVPERGFAVAVLTNAGWGAVLARQIVPWALEAYLGIVEPAADPLPLPAELLAAYAGEYRTATYSVTLTVEGDGLVVRQRYLEGALERLRKVLEVPNEEPPPATIRVLAGDRYLVTQGVGEGMRGNFVRRDEEIMGVNLGGRLAVRRNGG